MQANRRLLDWGVWVGGALMFSPLAGLLCTAAGMLYSFRQLGDAGISNPRALQLGVGLTLWGTAAGLVFFVVGVILFAVCLILRRRVQRVGPPPLPVTLA